MRLSFKLSAAFLVLGLFFVLVVVVNYQLSQRVLAIAQRVSASQHVTGRATQLYRRMVDMETGFRGYLLTSREESLQPYHEGARTVTTLTDELRRFTTRHSPQRARVDSAERQFRVWWLFSTRLISEKRAAHRRNPEQEGVAGLPSGYLAKNLTGKRMMDRVRTTLLEFERHEEHRRATQSEKLSEAVATTRTTTVLLTVLGLGLGLLAAVYLIQILTSRIRRQVAWAERLAEGDFSVRMADATGDELTQLSQALDQMADTLTTAIAQLENRNRELDQFAYIVSHDLKAPLRGMESVSRWIEEDYGKDQVPTQIQEFLMLMRLRVHRMESLIAGILTYSRIGRSTSLQETVDVSHLLKEIVEDLAAPPGMRIQLPPTAPVVFTSRTHLTQVFQNLLSNALKYHHRPQHGVIAVTWRLTTSHHVFAVTDDGPGIDPAYHEKIFQIFQTLQERDSFESTGIGLSIVKKIVEGHGGTITVSSAEGRGSTFTFTWPLSEMPGATSAAPVGAVTGAVAG